MLFITSPMCSHMQHSNVCAHIKKPKQWQPCPCLDTQKYSALQVGQPRKTECSSPNGWGTENGHMYTQFVSPKTGVLLPCNPLCAACEDKSGDCTGYGQSICTGQYAAWATDNCAKDCGHCGSGGGGGATSGAGKVLLCAFVVL